MVVEGVSVATIVAARSLFAWFNVNPKSEMFTIDTIAISTTEAKVAKTFIWGIFLIIVDNFSTKTRRDSA
jgi:hypothetical protein